MYAHDTTLVSTLEAFGDRRDPENIQRNINSELAKIYEWLSLNCLNLFSTNIPYMEYHFHELTLAQWCIIFGIINAVLH